jgi:hypothetical protein
MQLKSVPYLAAVEICCHVSITQANHITVKRKRIIGGTIKAASTSACPLDCLKHLK